MNLKQAFEAIGRDIMKITSRFSDYIPNTAKSDSTSSPSSRTVATSKAVKDVRDLANTIREGVININLEIKEAKKEINNSEQKINLKIQEIQGLLNADKETNILWSGNVTQNSTNIIRLSQSVLNKTVILYLQYSQSESLEKNAGVYTVSVFVDKNIINAVGRKYINAALYVDGWRNCQIELVHESEIRIIDISSMYLKKITAI